jgi:hypothetical protein
MKKGNHDSKFFHYSVFKIKHCSLLIIISFLISTFPYNNVNAQTKFSDVNAKGSYDEITVATLLESYGGITLEALYTDENLLYINIEDLFKKLKINYTTSTSGDSIKGFTESENKSFLIDYNSRQVKLPNKLLDCNKALIKEMGSIYMESSLFTEAFGITITFNFRSLTCFLKSNFELPLIKELRLEKMRNNLSKIKGVEKADTILNRNYHLFKFGVADWSLTTTQQLKRQVLNRFNLSVGAEFLFGEANISYNYSNQFKFDSKQLNYLWRWTDNNKTLIKQAQLGRIAQQNIAFINAPVIGAVIRNTPTTVRKATGYYTINEFTEPNWTIELYINNELVDYTKADASGRYVFKVPIVYGYTTAKLKFYGPVGEERTEERVFSTAFTLMPSKKFEYGLSAGIIQDGLFSKMGKAEFNYGINRFLTLGGGVEYLSSISSSPTIPFAKITVQPFHQLVINYEYAHGVKKHTLVNYYFKKNAFLEVNYSKFKEGQQATPFNTLQEFKTKLFVPVKYRMVSGYATIDYAALTYANYKHKQTTITFSGFYKRFGAISTTVLNQLPQKTSSATSCKSSLVFSVRCKNGFSVRPSTTVNISEKNVSLYGIEMEKIIKRGLVSCSYQKNILYSDYTIGLSLRYDLKFMKTSHTTIINKNSLTTSQNTQGSIAFGSGNNYLHMSRLSSVNKGGISLYPFLDVNQNGIFDKGEKMVKLTSVKIMSSNVIFNDKDSIIRIPELYAFTRYNLQFNDRDLENISWRFKNHIYNILIDPNQFKRVDIPIVPVGEVNGMVYVNANNLLKGIGRILIKIYTPNSTTPIVETLSEMDGYFQYLGLKPGNYRMSIDSLQLSKLGLTATPSEINFTIKSIEQGDIVDNANFILKKQEIVTVPPNTIIKQ